MNQANCVEAQVHKAVHPGVWISLQLHFEDLKGHPISVNAFDVM